ncbi:MAG: 4Fe-4S dicluster domain-containing protein [Candidatus Krumholzibacteria bacterium]|nr:4Fe-4S dicluster domain-containing protein [Candidatus Krumholzibacteria bacterium]
MMEPTTRTEADRDSKFARWIGEVPGAETIRQCIHCGVCSGSCPLSVYMDRSPRQLMYLAKDGFKIDVLSSFTIWLCTSCYACTVKCPRGIQVTEVMYALKRRAIEEGAYPKRFPIPVLAREFRKMVRKNGRISESRLVFQLMLRTNALKLLGLTSLGLKLIRTGRFSFGIEKIKRTEDLKTILEALERDREEVAA